MQLEDGDAPPEYYAEHPGETVMGYFGLVDDDMEPYWSAAGTRGSYRSTHAWTVLTSSAGYNSYAAGAQLRRRLWIFVRNVSGVLVVVRADTPYHCA